MKEPEQVKDILQRMGIKQPVVGQQPVQDKQPAAMNEEDKGGGNKGKNEDRRSGSPGRRE